MPETIFLHDGVTHFLAKEECRLVVVRFGDGIGNVNGQNQLGIYVIEVTYSILRFPRQ